MFSVKSSFADCSSCPLLEAQSCIMETNCQDDLSKVDVIFIAENPGKDEIKTEKPLTGKAGQMFRQFFTKFGLDRTNYLLTNVVLCQTLNPDGTTGNPTDEVIQRCKVNCFNIIEKCKPKLIVLMGASPLSAFGIAKTGITNLHGKTATWNNYNVFIMVHPSFVNRNQEVWTSKFEIAMSQVSEILSGKKLNIMDEHQVRPIGKGIHRYKIPEKFYTDEYRLVDVQMLNKTSQVLYMFRDSKNNKIIHKENDDYICYQAPKDIEARKIVPYELLNQVKIKYRDRGNLDPGITYEGDVRLTSKHAMDYYHFNQGEPPRKFNNIYFFDIEVDTGKERVFPSQKQARFPINLISTRYNGRAINYIVDNKTEPILPLPDVEFKIFDKEKDMLLQVIRDFHTLDPDYIAGWNLVNFDLYYIFNRLNIIGIPQASFNKYGEFFVEGEKYFCHMPGCVPLDQEFLYRTFTFTKMENYKLGFIAQHELGVTKEDLPLPFNEMYWKMLNKTIKYNARDTELIEKIEFKLAHINLLNELRIICNTSFDAVSSFGQIDSLMVSYLKSKGIASKNADPNIAKAQYPGAYVFEPIPGVYDWVTDFDFASLYPSLMITYNIGINSFVMKTKDPYIGYDLTYNPEKLPEQIDIILDPLYSEKHIKITPKQLLDKIKESNLVFTINGCFFQPHSKAFSVFGEVVDLLMTSRKDYKTKMFDAIVAKDKDLENFYYTRQLVYKVLANTLYGVVANKSFRFFDLSLASAITLGGQEALKTSIVYADAFMRHLDSGKDYASPKPVTKEEMFADPDKQPELYKFPDRSRDYIVTGDTDSIFCCFQKLKETKNIEVINEYCKKIEEFLNENIIMDMVKKHNVDLQYNRLKLKNELIISRGLFLAKKRYAIRVVANEGKAVDKINYMGVEIKRSDYPSKSKEFLKELAELILKPDKFSTVQILKFLERKEKEFRALINAGDKSIARPVSFGKELADYKMISQGVKAMTAWNDIMYDIHRMGAKAYMFWVRGIDFEKIPDPVERERIRGNYNKFISAGKKLEVIAIPDEEHGLPSFLVPDMKSSLKFSFSDRYELMLEHVLKNRNKPELLNI